MASTLTHRQGMALVVTAGIVWSLNGLFIRMIGDGAGAWQVLFYRSLGMVPALMLWLALTSGGGSIVARIRGTGWAGLIGGVGLIVAFSGAIYALQNTTIASAAFLFAAAPLITAMLARPVLGEHVRTTTWAAIVIAGAGIFLMMRDGIMRDGLTLASGNFAALASAAGFSVFTLSQRAARLGDSTPSLLIGTCLSLTVAFTMITLRGESLSVPPSAWILAMVMGAVTITGGMALVSAGVRVIPASEAGLLTLLEVLLSPVWVWIFFDEKVDANTLVGGLTVLIGLVLHALGASRRPLAAGPRPV